MERMNCMYGYDEVPFWNSVATFLFEPPSQQAPGKRLAVIVQTLRDVLLPFGVVDPVMALYCPLGTGALLHELAALCMDVLRERCVQRALRLLHLAKLFVLFSFNDYGAWFGHSRWRTDMNQLAMATQELTRLARTDDHSWLSERTSEPLYSQELNVRFGIVSYCNYNDSATKLTLLSRSNKRAYAARHGYTLLHFEEPFMAQAHPWMNKLIAIQRNLADFDWLFWVDCDLFFMNPHRTVDSLVRSAVIKNPDAALIIAEDGMMLNSGSFLIRRSSWAADFLARTIDLLSAPMPHSFQHMPWHEQAPLMYLSLLPWCLLDMDVMSAAQMPPQDGLTSGYDPHVVLLPQRAMNSYPPELVQKTEHAIAHKGYEEGDLVVSFNGCGSVLGGDYCEDLYQQYHDLSMMRFDHR